MTITVVNKYKEPNHVYCGKGSPLGNPFYMNGEHMRDNVCDRYAVYFNNCLDSFSDSLFNTELRRLIRLAKHGDVNLGCFCAPKRCHCDTIKGYLDSVL